MKAVLVRHLATDIAAGICYGRLDVGLSEAARQALPGFAQALAALGVARIWTSPATRCRALAEAVGAVGGIAVLCRPALQEMDFGAWEGRAWNDVPRKSLDSWAADPLAFAVPGGETGQAFLARVTSAWAEIREADADCMVVTHGGPLRLLPALARGAVPDLMAPTPAVGSVTVVAC